MGEKIYDIIIKRVLTFGDFFDSFINSVMDEKIIKLTNAVYKILDYFPEPEPLKNKIKDSALAVMKNPSAEDIDILLAYFQVAKNQKLISPANYFIITNEYKKIRSDRLAPVLQRQGSGAAKAAAILSKEDSARITERQKIILDFLRKNDKAQVADLQKSLPNITKRTIRRDLDELLRAGLIARFGEFNLVFYRIGQDRTDRTKEI